MCIFLIKAALVFSSEGFTEIGMGDGDEGLRSLAQGLTRQVRNAIGHFLL